MLSNDIKIWIETEAEPLFLTNASSHQAIQLHLEYPNLISGVLDSVANMALSTIGKMLHSLYHARLRWSTLSEENKQQSLDSGQLLLLDPPDAIEQRRQRAMTAFHFVRGESEFAAKPLE